MYFLEPVKDVATTFGIIAGFSVASGFAIQPLFAYEKWREYRKDWKKSPQIYDRPKTYLECLVDQFI